MVSEPLEVGGNPLALFLLLKALSYFSSSLLDPAAIANPNATSDLPVTAYVDPNGKSACWPFGWLVSTSPSQCRPSGTAGSSKFTTPWCELYIKRTVASSPRRAMPDT